jgi:single-stranded-DNA-specific exonuclease
VAGKIAEKYYRPTLVITRLIEEAELDATGEKLISKKVVFKGSGRSVEEFNMIAAVEQCAEFLDKYGGHPMACGFSIQGEENLEKFKAKILALATESLAQADLVPKLKIEAGLDFAALDRRLVDQIGALAPFGQNNPQPRLASFNLRIEDIMTMGFDKQHIKLRLVDDQSGRSFWGLAFGAAEAYKKFMIGDRVDVAYHLEINDFNGRQELQLKIIDLRLASAPAA